MSSKVCIIGAGSSGIAAAKVLHERGIPYECFEVGSGVGGNWRFRNDNKMSSAYVSLHINTSKQRMAYSDFPMPEEFPDYPHHTQVLEYLESYVDHFGFRDSITFRTEVVHASPLHEGRYKVRVRHLDSGEEETHPFEAVIVANGHHWDPNWPDVPGTFDGEVIHSHEYETPDILRDRRVLVVGAGNSAMDIACVAAREAKATYLSTRRGAHVIPRYLLGRPADHWVTPFTTRLPIWLQRLGINLLLYLTRGRQERYGFPTPDYPIGAEHPALSDRILDLVDEGKVLVRPDVDRLEGKSVVFDDATTEEIDLIIYATGYNISFPFFDEEFIRVEENNFPRYLYVVPPEHPGLYFLALLQPLGATMPIAEAQSEWIADLLEGKVGLPSEEEMWADIREREQALKERYVASKRHTMQVDFFPYLRRLEAERQEGRNRSPNARLGGGSRSAAPVTPSSEDGDMGRGCP